MAKVQQKSEKITAFGGIFFVLDKFDSILSSVIDSHLGLRSTLIAYLENRDGKPRYFSCRHIHLLHRFRQALAIHIPYTYHTLEYGMCMANTYHQPSISLPINSLP